MKELQINIDGASSGNPGPSGIGVMISSDGKQVRNLSVFIGNTTNNIAEYTALIYALQEALILKAEVLKIKTDSQLLERQLRGAYKVKDQGLTVLHNQARHLMAAFKSVIIENIPREENAGADKLAAEAVKKEVLL
jgi:ribonuclease HI